MRIYKALPISIGKIFLAVTLLSAFFILQEYTNHLVQAYPFDFSWFAISLKTSVTFLLWGALAPAVWVFSKTVNFKGLASTLKTILLGIGLALLQQTLVGTLIAIGFFIESGMWIQVFSWDSIMSTLLGLFSSLVQLTFYVAIFLFFDYYQRYLDKQKELNNAQLYALKMKLHPHFLFNTLHAISSMIDYNQEGAQKMLTRLGSLFRSILENEQEQTISLEKEFDYIRHYLEIEQVRFEEQLEVEFGVADDVLDASLPSLILQPLVENSIKHGISKTKEKGRIKIEAKRHEDSQGFERVVLTVIDNGQGFGNSVQKNFGIGIKNVNDRLMRLYDEDFRFDIGAGDKGGTIALIDIPYIKKSKA